MLYQVNGLIVYELKFEERCDCCGNWSTQRAKGSRIINTRINALTADMAKDAVLQANYNEEVNRDTADVFNFDWKWCEVNPVAEDVLMRELGYVQLPGFEGV